MLDILFRPQYVDSGSEPLKYVVIMPSFLSLVAPLVVKMPTNSANINKKVGVITHSFSVITRSFSELNIHHQRDMD